MNKNWIELIKDNIGNILEVGTKAYRDALQNTHLRFIVEMGNDGNVKSWYDVAGGNSFTQSSYDGNSIQLFQICHQHESIEIYDNDIIDKLHDEKLNLEIIQEIQDKAKNQESCTECIILEKYEELRYIIESCYQDAIDFEVSEHARDYITWEIDRLLENLSY